ncbi:recombinase family protein [Granulosicoccus sp.]|nr:recombinase family protein [Granulosicoccus sp.]MDB4223669.1 recombinase family protein [Granulosicoccus sp.]
MFTDQRISGTAVERDGLSHAPEAVQDGDTLVVWKFDHLGRSRGFLAELIGQFGKEGRGFIALQDGIDTTTTGGKLVFHIMASLAEFERDLFSERTTAGMSAAKRRGKHIGRPVSLSREQVMHAERQISNGEETIAGMASVLGVHRNTLGRAVNK